MALQDLRGDGDGAQRPVGGLGHDPQPVDQGRRLRLGVVVGVARRPVLQQPHQEAGQVLGEADLHGVDAAVGQQDRPAVEDPRQPPGEAPRGVRRPQGGRHAHHDPGPVVGRLQHDPLHHALALAVLVDVVAVLPGLAGDVEVALAHRLEAAVVDGEALPVGEGLGRRGPAEGVAGLAVDRDRAGHDVASDAAPQGADGALGLPAVEALVVDDPVEAAALQAAGEALGVLAVALDVLDVVPEPRPRVAAAEDRDAMAGLEHLLDRGQSEVPRASQDQNVHPALLSRAGGQPAGLCTKRRSRHSRDGVLLTR